MSILYYTHFRNLVGVQLELEVAYNYYRCSIVDYLGNIDGVPIGISVTRAFSYFGEFSDDDAIRLMTKKLGGLERAIVNGRDFDRGLLHVLVPNISIAKMCAAAIPVVKQNCELDDSLMVQITICDESKVYFEQKGDAMELASRPLISHL